MLLESDLEPVDLKRGERLTPRDGLITHVYFPGDALVSIVAERRGRAAEIGVVGRDGVSGISLIYGVSHSPYGTFVQIPGSAWRMEAKAFVATFSKSKELHARLLLYAHVFGLQTAETALANAVDTLDQRLARWLLICQDRLQTDEIAITHQFLATMLGVQRPAVTIAVQVLEGSGAIRASRALLTIRDRKILIGFAGTDYDGSGSEHRRLLGAM